MTLLKNGYPEDIITSTVRYKHLQFSTKPKFKPDRCPVYLRLLWISNASMKLIEQIERYISCCLNLLSYESFVNPMCCLPLISKTETVFQKSSLISKFLCKCNVCYIGHTSQRLDIQTNQNIPSKIHTNNSSHTTAPSNQNLSSAIAHH